MKDFLLIMFCVVSCHALAQTGQAVQAPILIKRVGSTDTIANTFQAAYDIARNGDIIYLPGGTFSLSSVFNKQLYIYGTGHNPDSSSAVRTTRIHANHTSHVDFIPVFPLETNSNGSFIFGVDFLDPIESNATISVNFQRCRIRGLRLNNVATINLNESVIEGTKSGAIFFNPSVVIWSLNISNSIIESTFFGELLNGGPPRANLTIKNSILLGANSSNSSLLRDLRRVEIDKSIIFLKPGAGSTLFSNVATQSITNNLIISDSLARVNTNLSSDYGNIIKPESYRDSVFMNRVGYPYSPSANYRTLPTCQDCVNKGVYSDGNGGTGHFRATPPVHISERSVSVGSTNNRLKIRFKVKPSN
jgi:hypothetical protein